MQFINLNAHFVFIKPAHYRPATAIAITLLWWADIGLKRYVNWEGILEQTTNERYQLVFMGLDRTLQHIGSKLSNDVMETIHP